MKNTMIVTLLAGVTLLAQTPPAKKTTTAPPAKKTTTAPPAKKAAGPPYNKALLNPALLKAKAPDVYKATFTTTKGDFLVEVHRDWAPNGADRFYNLVRAGFFNDASFFRAIQGFMVQFGISAYPAVSKAWHAADIKDDPVKQSNKRSYVSFAATSAPNSRSTQLFVNLADNARLDPSGFAPIGMVVQGMDVVDKLYMGYGEGAPGGAGPDQSKITEEGKAYLDKSFPQLDSVKTARITEPASPAPGAKPAVKPPAKKPAAATPPAKP